MWRAPRIAFAFLVASWGLFLSLQWGDPFDETEHCHVAWLMGHEHQKPLRDFFQHHQAPLWDVLKTFYLLGGQGPEVLYFGRVMVLTCALLSALGILLIGRWFARLADPDAPVPWDAGALGLLPVVLLSVVFQNVLVIRPETLSMPLFLLGALLWLPGADGVRRAGHGIQPFLAGMLVGSAVYTSPRFAPLAGSFLLLPTNRQHIVSFDWRRLLMLAIGAFAFGGIYSVVTSHTIAEVDFNLRFTRLMAHIGHGYFATAPWLVVLVVLSTLLGTFLNACLARSVNRRFLLQSAFLLVLAVVALVTCWPYLYPHNFFPVALWFGVMMASAQRGSIAGRSAKSGTRDELRGRRGGLTVPRLPARRRGFVHNDPGTRLAEAGAPGPVTAGRPSADGRTVSSHRRPGCVLLRQSYSGLRGPTPGRS